MRGNPHAAFDVAGAGNVAWSRWCDTRRRKGEPTGNTNIDLNRRVSPRPYCLREGNVARRGPVHCPYLLAINCNLEPPSDFGCSVGSIFIGLMGVLSCGFWVRLLPKPLGHWQCIDFQTLPPGHFIAGLIHLPVMTAAERYGELVADFETQRSGLRKPQMMRIGWLPAADQAGL